MTRSIGFIGGGQMAEAIIKGLLQSNFYSPGDIAVSEPIEIRQQYLEHTYSITISGDSRELCTTREIIVLAVKPQVMPTVLDQVRGVIKDKLIITIAAGLPISFYTERLANPSGQVVRVMPNMPALVQMGASALCKNDNVSETDFQFALSLFNTIGLSVTVPESSMDGVTGLSGSGPAYLFSFIEAMIDGGVKVGLGRQVARDLTIQTIVGACQLLHASGNHPAVLRDQVTSPGGTTASGLHALETAGFNGIVMSAVQAAFERSLELGNRK